MPDVLLRIVIPIVLAAIPVGSMPQPALIPPSGRIGNCSFITGEFHFPCIPLYLAYLIQLFFGFTGAIFLAQIIWAGYLIAFGAVTGDKEAGKKRLTSAIIGFIVSVLAFVIVDLVVATVT
ncbi:MAG: Uncharacterized protein Greene041619_1053 [Candidatus Peregrinibacteria bacterium Greene0416_19]|nr:MAG: Uncharacterized protein Greene041619_1053 [Candidatus Peregrinibacteria bacterium Greene0416_19]